MTERRAIHEFRSLLCGIIAVMEDEAESDRATARLEEAQDLLKRTDNLLNPPVSAAELSAWSAERRIERWGA